MNGLYIEPYIQIQNFHLYKFLEKMEIPANIIWQQAEDLIPKLKTKEILSPHQKIFYVESPFASTQELFLREHLRYLLNFLSPYVPTYTPNILIQTLLSYQDHHPEIQPHFSYIKEKLQDWMKNLQTQSPIKNNAIALTYLQCYDTILFSPLYQKTILNHMKQHELGHIALQYIFIQNFPALQNENLRKRITLAFGSLHESFAHGIESYTKEGMTAIIQRSKIRTPIKPQYNDPIIAAKEIRKKYWFATNGQPEYEEKMRCSFAKHFLDFQNL